MQHPRVIHESEIHRQHVRLRIPIQAEVDGVRHRVDDWSVGGFGVEGAMNARDPDEQFRVRLIFPFEEFEMSMRLNVRMVYVDRDHGRFGCAFVDLSERQLAVFRYLVEAYLSGEVVSAGDLLQVAGGVANRRRPPLETLDTTHAPVDEEPPAAGMRHRAGPAVIALAALVLLVLAGFGVKERHFTITAEHALVDAPLRQIRAPADGRFLSLVERGDALQTGDMLGTLRLADGSVVPLESPCDCVVVAHFGDGGELFRVGDPLAVLIVAGAPLMVRAQLPLELVEGLEAGDRAQIEMAGRTGPLYGEIVRIDVRPRLEAVRRSSSDLPLSRHHAQVLIRPDRPFDLEDFGALVRVHFL